jgi:hypothetical protein
MVLLSLCVPASRYLNGKNCEPRYKGKRINGVDQLRAEVIDARAKTLDISFESLCSDTRQDMG